MFIIPNDVITDILLRLPVKTLLRFRCVCKSWHTLIDSRDFVDMHLDRTEKSKSHMKLIHRDLISLYSADFDSIFSANIADLVEIKHNPLVEVQHHLVTSLREGASIIGCCNGLVCIYNSKDAAIMNISTRRHLNLPRYYIEWSGPEVMVFGFGYDVLSEDYKVVRIVQSGPGFGMQFYSQFIVYSLKSNSWRVGKPFPYYLNRFQAFNGVLASSALHWVVSETRRSEKLQVVAFDLATEDFELVMQPNYTSKESFFLHVESLGGCLSLIRRYKIEYVDIWVMKEYRKQESWTKIATITASAFCFNSFSFLRTVVYSLSENELLLEKDSKSLVRYDIEKKLVKNIEIRGQKWNGSMFSCVYHESLVPLETSGRRAAKEGSVELQTIKKNIKLKNR